VARPSARLRRPGPDAGLDLADPRALRDLLERHGVRAATSLGQRFLIDRSVLAAILEAAEVTGDDEVLEVGPGPGVLTRALAQRARAVAAVELDARMLEVLAEALAGTANVRVVRGDALQLDLYGLGERPFTRVVANLPYQITTPLLERFLGDPRRAPLVVVLVQEEVARRIVAGPRDARERGWLSVLVQSFATPRIVRRVPPRAFRPPPRVSSAIVALRTRREPAFAPLEQHSFLRFVSDVFRHRRKQLRGALGHEAGLDRAAAERALAAAAITPERRPEELALDEWVALATAVGVRRA
jgi:16S rRNA (adenine1518-N6/adenine1519-N6)-dimethyltransferase